MTQHHKRYLYIVFHIRARSLSRGCRFMRMVLSIYIDLVKDLLIRLNRCQKQLFAIFFCRFAHTTYSHACMPSSCLRHWWRALTAPWYNNTNDVFIESLRFYTFIPFYYISFHRNFKSRARKCRIDSNGTHTLTQPLVVRRARPRANTHLFIINSSIHEFTINLIDLIHSEWVCVVHAHLRWCERHTNTRC